MPPPTIALEGVSYAYPLGKGGVAGIDLRVEPGELVAVIGASGSGKTTLLKLVAGFLQPQAGRVSLAGRDVTGVSPRLRNLGLVFQSYALFPHMSAVENVAYPLKVRGIGWVERLRRAGALLDLVGLGAQAARRPATLSGGQQQRVALARALVFAPVALLLDEPLSALDAALRVEMRDEVRRIQLQQGIATLHVTHDQEEALSIADRVAVMAEGRLLQVAAPAELYDRPASVRVARFVGHANLWDATVAAPGELRLSFGTLRADTAGLAPGARRTIMVRPESVEVLPEAGAVNSFTGRLVRDRFLGPVRRYDLALDGATLLGETASRGQVRAVRIPPDAVRILDD
jgi:putative spermidine/putrescine transport system ATP-binding protein